MIKTNMTYYVAFIVWALAVHVSLTAVQATQKDNQEVSFLSTLEKKPQYQNQWSLQKKIMLGAVIIFCLGGTGLVLNHVFKKKQSDEQATHKNQEKLQNTSTFTRAPDNADKSSHQTEDVAQLTPTVETQAEEHTCNGALSTQEHQRKLCADAAENRMKTKRLR